MGGWVKEMIFNPLKVEELNNLSTKKDITYYVNSSTGTNDNDGLTESTAFKTFQYAIDILPKCLEHTVKIRLAAGTYNEDVYITGFYGGGLLDIRGADGGSEETILAEAAKFLVSSMEVNRTFMRVNISGLTFNGTTKDTSFKVQFSNPVWAAYCRAIGATAYGYKVENNAKALLYTCYVSNKSYAFNALYGGDCTIVKASGTGNTTAVLANWGGTARCTNAYNIGASTSYAKWQGGVITDENGDIVSTGT